LKSLMQPFPQSCWRKKKGGVFISTRHSQGPEMSPKKKVEKECKRKLNGGGKELNGKVWEKTMGRRRLQTITARKARHRKEKRGAYGNLPKEDVWRGKNGEKEFPQDGPKELKEKSNRTNGRPTGETRGPGKRELWRK